MITHFAHLPTPDPGVDVCHFELVLERVCGQGSIHGIPSPAQIDEWYLYQRYIASQKSKAVKAKSQSLLEAAYPIESRADQKTDVGNAE